MFGAQLGSEKYIGRFCLGCRNSRGQTLVDFLEKNNLNAMNTFFEKRSSSKWTWASADGHTKNEVDYVIALQRCIVTDVSVVNRFKTGCDHRMVRAVFQFNLYMEQNKLIRIPRKYEKEHYVCS